MINPKSKSDLIESLKEGAGKRNSDIERKSFDRLAILRQKLAFIVRDQIHSEQEKDTYGLNNNIEELEKFYELISTEKGFFGQIAEPPGNMDAQLSQVALDTRKECTDIITDMDIMLALSKKHNALMYERIALYLKENQEFLEIGKEEPIDVAPETEKRIRGLKNSLPEDVRNTLNYYFTEIIKYTGDIVDKINERGYSYLVDDDSCSSEFLNDMRGLSVKFGFAREIDNGIGKQHEDWENLDINNTSDLSDEDIDGHFNFINFEDENNLTLFEAEENADKYEKIRIESILEDVVGDKKIEEIRPKILMLLKGIMHHLHTLNHEMINDEIQDITREYTETEWKSQPLFQVTFMFYQLFLALRLANNMSAAQSIVN